MEILNFSTNKMLPRLKAHFLPRSIITEAFAKPSMVEAAAEAMEDGDLSKALEKMTQVRNWMNGG